MNTIRQKLGAFKNWFIHASRIKKVILIVIVVAGVWFAQSVVSGMSTQKPQYQTAIAERGTLVQSVTASGSVTSGNSASVTTQASGVVKEILVQNGDTVQAGQTIATIDLDQSSTQDQAAAYATYLSAVSSQKTAEQNKVSADATMWETQQKVLDAQNGVNYKNTNTTNPSTNNSYTDLEKQSIDSSLVQTRKSFDANEKKYKEADTAVSAANAQVTSAWLAYQQTAATIVAPISGTVNDISLQPGSVIAASTTGSDSSTSSDSTSDSNSSQTIASIKTSGTPTISVNLSEIDAPTVKVGDKATLTFDAFSGKTFTGKVTSIDTSGSVSSGVTTYPATITLDSPPEVLYPNMSVSAAIITHTKDDVITVSTAAVQTQDDQSTVRILKDGKVQTVDVETGLSNDTQIEIVSGINEGDTVITGQSSSSTKTTGQQNASPFSSFGSRGSGSGGGPVMIRKAN